MTKIYDKTTKKLYDAVLGLAIGDALGVPYEFRKRGTFQCTEMTGYGTWGQLPGTWSDDTSMTLATCDSIRILGKIDYTDLMERFLEWFHNADYTCRGEVFDVGGTTRKAIYKFMRGTNPLLCGGTEFSECGNGSLMRILPLAFTNCTDDQIAKVSSLTHAHEIPINYCIQYVRIARKLISGETVKDALAMFEDVTRLPIELVRSTGYVLDTFNAAIWCLANTDNYADCVLTAVNLGEDTDTVAAVAGGLAGIVYGAENIPKEWKNRLANRKFIDKFVKWR